MANRSRIQSTFTGSEFAWGILYLGTALILVSPLLVDSSFFFPFISTKVFLFRASVEIMLAAFLYLLWRNPELRPSALSPITIFLLLFIFVSFLSSAFGPNFYISFWGNMERGEGLILWLHLLAYLFILSLVLREEKRQLAMFDVSVGASLLVSLFALGQILGLKSLLNTTGLRVGATLGNPAFLAGYLIFNLAFAAYLFTKRQQFYLHLYYSAVFIFEFYIIIETLTRGAILGLFAGLFSAFFILIILSRSSALRKISIAGLALLITGALFIYSQRNAPWIENYGPLMRIASISPTERTAETRLATWKAGLKGWKEHLIIGIGMENFGIVFNKYFPPIIYEDAGSQVWFDHAHNVIIDRGVTTGVVGLALYLLFVFYPAYYFLRHLRKDTGKKWLVVIFSALIAAFFVQNLFIFESITVYVVFFLAWAFFMRYIQPVESIKIPKFSDSFYRGVFIASIIALLPILFLVNIEPAEANLAASRAMKMGEKKASFFDVVDSFKKALSKNVYGRQEYRVQFIEYVSNKLRSVGEVVPEVRSVLDYTEGELDRQIDANPLSAKNFLLAMRYYNFTRNTEPEKKFEKLQKALSYYPEGVRLSPTRPHIHQEAGYTYLYLYHAYNEAGKTEEALRAALKAEELFIKTRDLNPRVVESSLNLILLYSNTNQPDKIKEVVVVMEEANASYESRDHLDRFISVVADDKHYEWVVFFAQKLTEVYPDDPDAWIKLAAGYGLSGDKEKAIEIADRIKKFGGDYEKEADAFISQINAGTFGKETE